ncbi:Ribonuclease H protein [Quillaja saponaria]|uniref:Ribonuclease H protein n=1 Tax=Quillaja saponaria TaxID=32244 RepID=A0AAD7L5W2_QUISA|nr:Ribonuclease H protein [Quillaja saponaria]
MPMGGGHVVLSKDYKNLIVDVDSRVVVEVCNKGYDKVNVNRDIVEAIQKLLLFNWDVQIAHVYREANRCADSLAKLVLNGDLRDSLWQDPPSALDLCLLSDVLKIGWDCAVPVSCS